VSDRLGISTLAEDPKDTACGDRAEEVFEVAVQDHALACVAAGIGDSRASSAKALRGPVHRDLVEDLPEHDALEVLEERLRLFEHAHAAAWF
jgi:hypothetical protein